MKKLLSIIGMILGFTILPLANGATTYVVHNIPEMRLNSGITAAQTANIKIAPPRRNGKKLLYPTTSGGILLFEASQYSEYIYYPSATVDSDLVITLTGTPVRGYCATLNTFASCENGRAWGKGTRVTLVDDMRLFNFSAKIDAVNTYTGSGRNISDQTTQTWLTPTNVTTTQRDAFTDVRQGDIIFNTTTGTHQYYDGSSWGNAASGALINAAEAIRGVIELATLAEQASGSTLGSTGAPLVLQAKNTTQSGGTANQGKVLVLDDDGILDVNIGGTGSGFLHTGTGVMLLTQSGSNGFKILSTTTTNDVLKYDGTNIVFGSFPLSSQKVATAASTATGASSTVISEFDTSRYTISANTLAAGDNFCFNGGFTYTLTDTGGTDNVQFRIRMQNSNVATQLVGSWGQEASITGMLHTCMTVRSIGASGKVITSGYIVSSNTTETSQVQPYGATSEVTLDTTSDINVRMTVQFNASNVSNTATLTSWTVDPIKSQ